MILKNDNFRIRKSLDQQYIKPTVTPKINYSTHQNRKDLRKTIESINEDQKVLLKNIALLITQLHKDQRENDINNYSLISNRLKVIIGEQFNGGKTLTEDQKKTLEDKIKVILYQANLSKVQRDQITNVIEEEFSTIENTYSKNQRTERNYDSTLTEDSTISLYKSILSNESVVRRISQVVGNSIIGKYFEEDQKKLSQKKINLQIENSTLDKQFEHDNHKLSEQLNEIKKKNRNLFEISNRRQARRSSFSTLVSHGNKLNIFLIKYNSIIYSKFKSEMQNIKRLKSMDQMRKQLMPRYIAQRMKKDIRKWWKTKTSFTKMFKPSYWKKYYKKTSGKIIDFLKFSRKRTILWSSIGLASGAILVFGNMLLKTGITAFKIGIGLTRSIFNLTTKVFGGVISILKGIVTTSLKIAKNALSSGYHLLNRIKLFLFSPVGMYMTGFIIGFFKDKILEKYKSLVEWVKTTSKKIKDWIKEKGGGFYEKIKKDIDEEDLRLNTTPENERTPFDYIKLWFLNKAKRLKQYMSIFSEENKDKTFSEKMELLKEMLDIDTGYADKILKLEDIIGGIDGQEFKQAWNTISGALNQFMESDVVRTIGTLGSLTGTGVPSRAITSAAVSQGVKRGAQIVGIAIGTIFGPIGSIVGGSLGSIIGSLSEKLILHGFLKMKYSNGDKNEQLKFLRNEDDNLIKNKRERMLNLQRSKRDRIQDDIDRLKSANADKSKIDEKAKELEEQEKTLKLLEELESVDNRDATKRLNGVSDEMMGLQTYLKNDADGYSKIINFLTEENKDEAKKLMDNLIEKGKQIDEDISPDVRKIMEISSEHMKQVMLRYSDDYDRGYITKEQFQNLVKNANKKMRDQRIHKDIDLTIGQILDNPKDEKIEKIIEDGYKVSKYIPSYTIGASTQVDVKKMYSDDIREMLNGQFDNTTANDTLFDTLFMQYRRIKGDSIAKYKTDFRKFYGKVYGNPTYRETLKLNDLKTMLFKYWDILYDSLEEEEKFVEDYQSNKDEKMEKIKNITGLTSLNYAGFVEDVNGILLPKTKSQESKMLVELMKGKEGQDISKEVEEYDKAKDAYERSSKKLKTITDLNYDILQFYKKIKRPSFVIDNVASESNGAFNTSYGNGQ